MLNPFYAWMAARSWNATYRLTWGLGEALDPGWQVIAEVPCRSATFALRSVLVLQRQTPQSAGAEPCPAPAVSP